MTIDLRATKIASEGRGSRRSSEGRRRSRWIWFALPSLALVVVFFIVPFVLNVPFAFSQWSGYQAGIPFVGLDNFVSLWSDGTLGGAVIVTLVYAIVCMLVQNIVALSLALCLQKSRRVNSVYRSVFFLPVLISPLAAGYIWHAILAQNGPLNLAVAAVVPGFSFNWLGYPVSALLAVAFVDGWKWSGIATLVYIAGLNSVPGSLLEAATIDGAGRWKRFWRISFPLLAPAFTFNIVTTFIGALNAYDVIAATTNGGPGTATTTLNVAAVHQFGLGYFGTASTLTLTVTILVVVLAVPLVAWLRKREVAA